jgi:hypothetical protein
LSVVISVRAATAVVGCRESLPGFVRFVICLGRPFLDDIAGQVGCPATKGMKTNEWPSSLPRRRALAHPLVADRRGCRGSDAQGRVLKMIYAERLEMIFGCP